MFNNLYQINFLFLTNPSQCKKRLKQIFLKMGNDREEKGEKEKGDRERDKRERDRGRKKREEFTDSEVHKRRKSSLKRNKSKLRQMGGKIKRGASSVADVMYPGRLSGGDASRSRGNSPVSLIKRVQNSLSRSRSRSRSRESLAKPKNKHHEKLVPIYPSDDQNRHTVRKIRRGAPKRSPSNSSSNPSDHQSSDYGGDTEYNSDREGRYRSKDPRGQSDSDREGQYRSKDPRGQSDSDREGRYRSKDPRGQSDRQDRREEGRYRENKTTDNITNMNTIVNLVNKLMNDKEKKTEEQQREKASIAFKAPKGLLKATYTELEGGSRLVNVDHKKIRRYRDEIKNTFPTLDANTIKSFIRRFDYLGAKGFTEAEYNHMLASFLSPTIRAKLESNNIILEDLSANEFIFNLCLVVLGFVPTSDELIKQFRKERFHESDRAKPLDFLVRIESLAHQVGEDWDENNRNKEIFEKIARILPSTLYADFENKCRVNASGLKIYPSTQELKIYVAKHTEFIAATRPKGPIVRMHQVGADGSSTDSSNPFFHQNPSTYGAYGGQIYQVGAIQNPPPHHNPNLAPTQTGQVNRDGSGVGRFPAGSNPPNDFSCTFCDRPFHKTEDCIKHPDPVKREENKRILDRRMELKRERERGTKATFSHLNTCLLCASMNHNSSTCTMYPGISPAQEACKLHVSHGISNLFHPTANCILQYKKGN